jgi:ribosomal protein L32
MPLCVTGFASGRNYGIVPPNMVVRMRANRSKTRKRRSHHGLSAARLTADQKGGVHLRHRADPETGLYRGKGIIDVVARAKREQRRMKRKEKELRASGQQTESKEKQTADPK